MIIDHISNGTMYKGLTERLDKGLEYLMTTDLTQLEVGKYPIEGDDVFVLIQEYEGKSIEEANCEAHKKYIDIQYIIEGDEIMGYAPVEGMEIVDPYNEEKDRFFVKWEGTLCTFKPEMFAVFFPQDAHMPGVKLTEGKKVKKAVVKVRV